MWNISDSMTIHGIWANTDTTLLKRSLWELYEDIQDRQIIVEFEEKEDMGKVRFHSAEDILHL